MHSNFMTLSDGSLIDMRIAGVKPLRTNFSAHHNEITCAADLKACLRAGQYTDVGGYPLYFVTSDGAALSFEAVRSELHSVLWSIQNRVSDGWRVVACTINYEDTELTCDHTNKRIPSSYADDESESE